MAYQNTEHERTFFERETSKLAIQMLESLAVMWDASTRTRLLSERRSREENGEPQYKPVNCCKARGKGVLYTCRDFSGATQGQVWFRSSSCSAYWCDADKLNANTYLQNCRVVTPKSFFIAFQPCLGNTENYCGRSTRARKLMLNASCSSLRYPTTWAASSGKEWARSAVGIQRWHGIYV